jgi:hypothetical protein
MRQDAEKGSALLIVFVLAAIVAITLYLETPVTVFEAKRRQEQLTIDHGKEYAHAVKLFVRKIGRYPSSLDELQNTNNMRFLRHKFKDPFTGDDDWRLLHAGPGGVIIDSKVKPAGTSTFTGNTSAAGFGSNSGGSNSTNNGSNATSSNSPTNGSNASTASSEPDFPMAGSIAAEATETVQPAAPKRPPAVAANGSKAASANSSDQSPWQSLVPPIPGEQNENAGQASANASPGAEGNSGTGAAGNATPGLQRAAAANEANGQPSGGPTNAQGQNSATNLQNTVSQLSGSGGQATAGTTGNTFGSTQGTITGGGGIAGVAVPDKIAGAGIKAVNDQHKYKLWEFYYDPTQDTLKMPGTQTPQGTTNPNTGGTSTFGNNGSASGGGVFGSNGNSGTSFGSPSTESNSNGGNAGSGASPASSNTTPPQQQ